jgi:hypothetical protein
MIFRIISILYSIFRVLNRNVNRISVKKESWSLVKIIENPFVVCCYFFYVFECLQIGFGLVTEFIGFLHFIITSKNNSSWIYTI